MKTQHRPFFALTSLLFVVAVGCGSGADGDLTKAQEEAARHPVANPNYKGPDATAQAQMGQQIAEYQKKHQNDKVEFK